MATKGASWTDHWRGRDHSCIRHHIAATVWWFQVRLTITSEESYLHLTVQSRKIKQGGFINYLLRLVNLDSRIQRNKHFVSRQDRITTLYNDIQSWCQKASNCFKIKMFGSQFWLRKSNVSWNHSKCTTWFFKGGLLTGVVTGDFSLLGESATQSKKTEKKASVWVASGCAGLLLVSVEGGS